MPRNRRTPMDVTRRARSIKGPEATLAGPTCARRALRVRKAAQVRTRARVSLASRLGAIGLLGALLGVVVLIAALIAFGHVHSSQRAAALIGQAQRLHQDADQAHDALHADVLAVLRASTSADPGAPAQAELALRADVQTFRVNVERAQGLSMPSRLSQALALLRPAQDAYANHAVRLGDRAVSGPIPTAQELAAFQDEFGRLARTQAQVTDELAKAGADTQARSSRTQDNAEAAVVTAAGIALSGLLVMTVALTRMGRRLGVVIGRERQVAETLQRSLLPAALPELPGAQLVGRFRPCATGAQVGGDWYDAIPLPAGAVALVIGDVTGHDIAAASAMGQVRNALRAWALDNVAPAGVLSKLNNLLFTFNAEHCATCVLVKLSPAQADRSGPATVCVANAGHCPPLTISSRGEVAFLDDQRPLPPLGAVRGLRFSERSYLLEPGSTLLLYTDGLIERRGETLDRGLDRLRAAASTAARAGPVDAGALCDALLAELFDETRAADDVALLALTMFQSAALLRRAESPPTVATR